MVTVESRWSRWSRGGRSGVTSSMSRWVAKAWACSLVRCSLSPSPSAPKGWLRHLGFSSNPPPLATRAVGWRQALWFGSTSTPTMTPPGSDSDEPRPRCFSLFVLLFNDNIFNGRSRDPLDGCGVFGVDGCGLVVGFVGAVARSGWSHGCEWVMVGFYWGFGSQWVGVACGGFICGGSGWFLVHPVVLGGGFGSPMGRGGLPSGLWWFFGWVAVVMVGLAMLGALTKTPNPIPSLYMATSLPPLLTSSTLKKHYERNGGKDLVVVELFSIKDVLEHTRKIH
uniref:Uncharacterized protein n=1 Tax=Fagus sylvatica TaxID=28930 RepID=A0A2N9EEI9_FAGSY